MFCWRRDTLLTVTEIIYLDLTPCFTMQAVAGHIHMQQSQSYYEVCWLQLDYPAAPFIVDSSFLLNLDLLWSFGRRSHWKSRGEVYYWYSSPILVSQTLGLKLLGDISPSDWIVKLGGRRKPFPMQDQQACKGDPSLPLVPPGWRVCFLVFHARSFCCVGTKAPSRRCLHRAFCPSALVWARDSTRCMS